MAKTTSFNLGNHFEEFISSQVESGRYSNASEVLRASLRLMESQEKKEARAAIQGMVDSALASGISKHSIDEVFTTAKQKAKELGLDAS